MADPITPKTADEATRAFEEPHSYVDVEHGKLAYWTFGRGPDVVLVHGWPLHSVTFRAQIPALAEKFTLHLFDLPGTGHSEYTGRIGLAEDAAALRQAIDRLDLDRYAIVAHDSGAVMARLVAADDPRVRALVLGNTEIPGHRSRVLEFLVATARLPGGGKLLTNAMRLAAIRHSFLGFGGCFRDPAFADGQFGDLFVRPLLASSRLAEGQMALARNIDFDLIDRLAAVHTKIRAPVLCIWGTDDPFFPLEKARRMLPEFSGDTELVEIAGAKLFAHEDHPDAFNAPMLAFLSRTTDESRAQGGHRANAIS